MTVTERISAFAELGKRLRIKATEGSLSGIIGSAFAENHWFTKENVLSALNAICTEMLDENKLRRWINGYDLHDDMPAKNIAIVMAGNIPLVGFSDLLYALITGNTVMIKPSSKDTVLMNYMIESLRKISPEFEIVSLTNDKTKTPDAAIATGGNQANIHFKAAFADIPSILRTDRTSIAVLNGEEDENQLEKLWNDIFLYFGLGCRNVSRMFIPENYDLNRLVEIFGRHEITHPSFLNEYRQNKALLTMQDTDYIDGGFFTFSEEGNIMKLSNIIISRYSDQNEVQQWLSDNENHIQCVVSANREYIHRVDFGRSQQPSLSDYPDGVDVIRFLLSL